LENRINELDKWLSYAINTSGLIIGILVDEHPNDRINLEKHLWEVTNDLKKMKDKLKREWKMYQERNK